MKRFVLAAAAAAVLSVPAALAAPGSLPTSVGKGEGKLLLVAWQGHMQPQWVKPFERQTGCKTQVKYANTSDEMVALMRSGGGGQYDLVSASGDASLRLIYGHDVAEVNVNLVPSWKNFFNAFKSPPNNTVGGKHYGVSLQFGPNILSNSRSSAMAWSSQFTVCIASLSSHDLQRSGKVRGKATLLSQGWHQPDDWRSSLSMDRFQTSASSSGQNPTAAWKSPIACMATVWRSMHSGGFMAKKRAKNLARHSNFSRK